MCKKIILKLCILAMVLALNGATIAGTLYTEDFNDGVDGNSVTDLGWSLWNGDVKTGDSTSLNGVAIDGSQGTDGYLNGAYDSISGPGASATTYTVTADAYVASNTQNSGFLLGSSGNFFYITLQYNGQGSGWLFDARPLTGDSGDSGYLGSLGDGEGEVVALTIEFDIDANEITATVEHSGGTLTQTYGYPAGNEDNITRVGVLDELQQAGWKYGIDIDNIVVSETLSSPAPTAATNPNPSNSATGINKNADLSWTPGSYLQDTNEHQVYFGTSFSDVNTATTASSQYKGAVDTNSYEPGTMSDNTTYYWRIDEVNTPSVATGSVWDFTTYNPTAEATNPEPSDSETNVSMAADLSWTEGDLVQDTDEHQVYFGTSFSDVNTATTASSQYEGVVDTASYDPGVMDSDTQYYWRIDEVNTSDGNSPWKGTVWDFTTEAYGTGIIPVGDISATADHNSSNTSPDYAVDGTGMTGDLHSATESDHWKSGADTNGHDNPNPGSIEGIAWIEADLGAIYKLDYIWVWNYNDDYTPTYFTRGMRNVTIEYSATGGSDSSEWSTVGDGDYTLTPSYPADDGKAHTDEIDFGGVSARYVVITANDVKGNFGDPDGVHGLAEVRFYKVVSFALNPDPPVDSAGVADDVELGWSVSRFSADANGHDVYLGTSSTDVTNATTSSSEYMGRETNASYATIDLEPNTLYYWRIDEVNGSVVEGQVWNFTTIPASATSVTTTASSEGYGGAVAITDGSGLSNLLHTNDWTKMWASNDNDDVNPGTISGPVWVRSDLGAIYQMNELWVWNMNETGFTKRGLRNVTIEYSTSGGSDSSEWTELGDYEFAEGSGSSSYAHNTVVDFGDTEARYIVITANDVDGNWGWTAPPYQETRYALSELLYLGIVNYAFNMEPDDGDTGVPLDATLSWSAGNLIQDTNGHHVYLGTSFSDVDSATTASSQFKGAQSTMTYSTSTLDSNSVYYWRIDEVNSADGNSPWKSSVLSFTTIPETAWYSYPYSGATSLGRWLGWSAGYYAADTNGHDVYFGTSFSDVNTATTASSEYTVRQTATAYCTDDFNDGNGIEIDTAYYWRVDEINDGGVVTTGDVWSFTASNRRIIFNSDGYGVTISNSGAITKGGTVQEQLEQWKAYIFDPLEDSQIDTLSWCDGSGGNTALYGSDVLEAWGERIGVTQPTITQWIADGNDPAVVVVEEGHKRGLEVWYSFRINDIHDSGEPPEYPTFKEDNPSWMIGEGTDYGYKTALRFDVCDVRNIKFDTIEELFVKYDFDGVEIDFMRGPPFFDCYSEPNNAYHLTNLVNDVRVRLNEIAVSRGRPIMIAARVDENINACDLDGFDVNSWVSNDSIDILILGSSAIDINVADFTAITAGTDVEIYPCLYAYYRVNPDVPLTTMELARGQAKNFAYQGADGIYTFNFYLHPWFQTGIDIHWNIGDTSNMAGNDKSFWAGRGAPSREYPHNLMNLSLPNDLSVSETITFPILVGEDINGTYEPNSIDFVVSCENLDGNDTLVIKMNGNTLSQSRNDQTITMSLTSSQVLTGENTGEIQLSAGSCSISGAAIKVVYESGTTAPTPNPMTWSSEPNAVSSSQIDMTATTGTDESGVEYYFECTTDGNASSSWQNSASYSATSLGANTLYTFKVKARDKSPNLNETSYSDPCSATTDSSMVTLIDGESFEGTWPPSGWSETGRWNKEINQVYDSANSADFDGGGGGQSGDLTTPDLDCSDASQITVTFYGYDQGADDTEYYIDYYDGTGWDQIQRLDNFGEGSWTQYSDTITDSQYFKSTFKVRWRVVSLDNNEHVYVDLVNITKE